MDVTRDDFDRIVPHNLIAKFRDRPSAVCPLCDGMGVRRDGRQDKICHVCDGHGSLSVAKLKLLSPEYLEICKGFRCLPAVDSIPVESNGHQPKKRKPEPVAS